MLLDSHILLCDSRSWYISNFLVYFLFQTTQCTLQGLRLKERVFFTIAAYNKDLWLEEILQIYKTMEIM